MKKREQMATECQSLVSPGPGPVCVSWSLNAFHGFFFYDEEDQLHLTLKGCLPLAINQPEFCLPGAFGKPKLPNQPVVIGRRCVC